MIDRLNSAGTESQLLALLRTLDREVVKPELILLDGDGANSRALQPTHCHVVRLGVKKLGSVKALSAAMRLRSHWRTTRPDIVQVYFHDSAYFAVPVARLAGVPTILRVRNNLGYDQSRKHRLLGRCLRPMISGFVTNTAAGRDAIVQVEKIPGERVHVIENGVDLERFPLSPSSRSNSEVKVGCVANLRTVKNIDGLMRVAHRLLPQYPHLSFHVAGDGEQRAELEQLHTQLALGDRLRLHGSRTDIPAFLQSLDIAVLPSHTEGMSNAVLEYMAAGKPIVATDVGANAALVTHGVCGWIVPPGDGDALASALSRLIEDRDTRMTFGVAARQRVERYFSREAMRQRFEAFYTKHGSTGCGE